MLSTFLQGVNKTKQIRQRRDRIATLLYWRLHRCSRWIIRNARLYRFKRPVKSMLTHLWIDVDACIATKWRRRVNLPIPKKTRGIVSLLHRYCIACASKLYCVYIVIVSLQLWLRRGCTGIVPPQLRPYRVCIEIAVARVCEGRDH